MVNNGTSKHCVSLILLRLEIHKKHVRINNRQNKQLLNGTEIYYQTGEMEVHIKQLQVSYSGLLMEEH